MNAISVEQIAAIVEHCCRSADSFSTALTECFGQDFRVQSGETMVWNPDWDASSLEQAGLSIRVRLGDQRMLCLLPESVGLPAWYAAPDQDQQQQLQTLAQEWSRQSLPDDLTADEVEWSVVQNLSQTVSDGHLDEQTRIIPWRPMEPETSAAIHVIVPVGSTTSAVDDAQAPQDSTERPRDVMMGIPVMVSVRLAQKRIEMKQVLEIVPGALIMFDKPCDEPLDLYVNNHKYCCGEAVKVGDKFGLKIDVIGRFEAEPERIISY